MTLLDAQDYDPQKDRKKKIRIIAAVVTVLVVAGLLWWFRYWPEEHVASKFFDALQQQQFESAYGIWMHDPDWKQHTDRYTRYNYGAFYGDWGPGSEWGTIKTAKVYGSSTCGSGGSGVVVDVVINDRVKHAQVWVEKSDKTMSYPPCELLFH